MIYHYFFQPFVDYDFMLSALLACLCLSVSNIPLGVLMILRRMGLMGEALSHGILPGIAIAFLISGLSVVSMTIGGVVAGLCVALLSQFIARKSILPEDSSLTALYIIFLSVGFLLISIADSGVHLTHILFGSILSINTEALNMIIGLSISTVILLVLLIRPFLWISFDPSFSKGKGVPVHIMNAIFIILIVLNIVASCQALGTLMALGLMLLPPITMRLWTQKFNMLMIGSIFIGIIGSFLGILFSFHYNLASGPSIILCLGVFFLSTFVYKTCFIHS
jgi:zinc/manganese transport system permease protein